MLSTQFKEKSNAKETTMPASTGLGQITCPF